MGPAGNLMNAMKKHVLPLLKDGEVRTTTVATTTTTTPAATKFDNSGFEGEWKTQKFTFKNDGGPMLESWFPDIQTENPEFYELMRQNFMAFLKTAVKKDD